MKFATFNPLVLVACLLFGANLSYSAPPAELIEAEATYIANAAKRLSTASDDADARGKLANLNRSFLNHLERLHPKALANDREGAAEIEIRINLIKKKLDSSLPLKSLDARPELRTLSGSTVAEAPPQPPVTGKTTQPGIGENVPTGELSSRSDGKRVEVGESFEIKGRTKNVPKGYAVSVFAGKTTAGLFPRENRKDPNRRFTVNPQASDVWLGQVRFILMIVPEDTMTEIEQWFAERNQWENAGFPRAETPLFRGRKAGSLYEQDYIKAGAIVLAKIQVEYAR